MTIDTLEETRTDEKPEVKAGEPAAETPTPTPEDERARLRRELDRLLSFREKKVVGKNQTACPACNTLVDVTSNDCPHCDSYIAPNNALVREALREIRDIEARLNGEHGDVSASQREPGKRSFWDRLFGRTPEVSENELPIKQLPADGGPRFLDRISEGDQLIVLARVGAWYKVKTRDSRIGWLYSTFIDKQT